MASVAVDRTVVPVAPVTRNVPLLVRVPPLRVPADQVEPLPASVIPPVREIVPPLHSRLPPMARLPAPERLPFDIVMSPVTVIAEAPLMVPLVRSSPPSDTALLAVSVPPLLTAKVAVLLAMPLIVVTSPPP